MRGLVSDTNALQHAAGRPAHVKMEENGRFGNSRNK